MRVFQTRCGSRRRMLSIALRTSGVFFQKLVVFSVFSVPLW